MLILFNQITLSVTLNDKKVESFTQQLENLEAEELNLVVNFVYWSYMLSKYDVDVRHAVTQVLPLISLLSKYTASYATVNTTALTDYKKSYSSFLKQVLKRNSSYRSWETTVQKCEKTQNPQLQKFLEEIQTLGQEITQKEISSNQALFDDIKKEGYNLQETGKQLVLLGRMCNAFGEKKVPKPNSDISEPMLDLIAFDSACRLTPLLETESTKIRNTLDIFEREKVKLLEIARNFFYELYLVIYNQNKKNSKKCFFKLITESNSIEQDISTVLPLPEDLLKN